MKHIRYKTSYCKDIVVIEVVSALPISLSLVYGTIYKAENCDLPYVRNDNISNHLKKNSIFYWKIL